MNAADKRSAAIDAFTEKYRPKDNGYRLLPNVTAQDAITDIRAMADLGRTQRWQNAIKGWEQMIIDFPDDLEWAILQGGIYAGHAAD